MQFNDMEKQIIENINNGKVKSISTFVSNHFKTEYYSANVDYILPGYNQFSFTTQMKNGVLLISEDNLIPQIKTFIALWELLSKNDFITVYEIGPDDIHNNINSLFQKAPSGYKFA